MLTQPFAGPLATPDETFACLVAASDRYRAGDRDVRLEFCIEHAQVLADVGQFLPERADGTAMHYAERVTQRIDGRRFGLVVDDVQAYDATLWLRLRAFLRGLFVHIGVPGDACKATVFLGNYDRTPFGLHRGDSANFMFVVGGRKRMRTWPDAFFRGKEDLTYSLRYAHYNDDSIVMDANPGDVIFWPSDYWHIGESVDGGLSSAVSVALFMEPRPATDVLSRAAPLVQRHMSRPSTPAVGLRSQHATAEAIEGEAARAIAGLRSAAAEPALERGLRIGMLNRATASGFTRPPAPRPHRALADAQVVRGHADYPVRWMRDQDDEIVCSANGHAFTVAASPRVLALIAVLNGGDEHRVGDLLEKYSGTAEVDGVEFETSQESVRALLEKLATLRALACEQD